MLFIYSLTFDHISIYCNILIIQFIYSFIVHIFICLFIIIIFYIFICPNSYQPIYLFNLFTYLPICLFIFRFNSLGRFAPTEEQRLAFNKILRKVTQILAMVSIFSVLRLTILGKIRKEKNEVLYKKSNLKQCNTRQYDILFYTQLIYHNIFFFFFCDRTKILFDSE